jgi:hypothetical protein
MKTTTLYIVVSLSIAVLVIATLYQKPVQTKKSKEGFEVTANAKEIGIGVAIALGILLVIFGGFFVFFYSHPKQPNVVVPSRKSFYYNLE